MNVWTRFRSRVVTADAIYGTILFAALIAVASDERGANGAGDGIPGDATQHGVVVELGGNVVDRVSVFEALLLASVTLIVFWLAHVYARTIAGHGAAKGLRTAIGDAFEASSGMLVAAVPSTIVLLLGLIGVFPDAADWSLFVAILVLGILGYQSFAERGSKVWTRILGAVVSGLLGLILVILDAAVH